MKIVIFFSIGKKQDICFIYFVGRQECFHREWYMENENGR